MPLPSHLRRQHCILSEAQARSAALFTNASRYVAVPAHSQAAGPPLPSKCHVKLYDTGRTETQIDFRSQAPPLALTVI